MSVINTSALAGASGQAAGSGYEIQRSLRFNSGDSSHLAKTFSTDSTTFSISFWFKRTNINPGNIYNHIFNSNSGSGFGIATYQDFIYLYNNAHPYTSGRLLRDPSAWYHVFVSSNSGSASLYVNNQLVQTVTGASYGSTARIGGWNGGSYFTDGYLADVHFLDGIAASASDFGEYDDNNVWQPKKYNGSYNVAAVSGTSITTTVTASAGFNSSYPGSNAIDGSVTTYAQGNVVEDGNIEFTFSPAIPFSSSVEVNCYAPNGYGIVNYSDIDVGSGYEGQQTFIGSNAYNFNSNAWITVKSGSGSVSKIKIRNTRIGSSTATTVYAIRIDGGGNLTSAGLPGSAAGTNGFHLDFSDNSSPSALGTDSSPNSNNFDVYNLQTAKAINAVAGTHSGKAGISFNGTDQDIRLTPNSDLNPGSGAFTFECYAYAASGGSDEFGIYDGSPGGTGALVIRRVSGGTIYVERNGQAFDVTGSGMTENTWHHIAVTRDSSNNVRMFLNGTQTGSTSTNNTHDYTGTFQMGRTNNGFTNGYISNVRLIKGTALYTSNFTAPTGTLGNVANTKLLMAQSTSSVTEAAVLPAGVVIDGSGDGTGIDSLRDSPTNGDPTNDTGAGGELSGNYCTFNPLKEKTGGYSMAYADGNLELSGGGDGVGTIPFTSGKKYFELTIKSASAFAQGYYGIVDINQGAPRMWANSQIAAFRDVGTLFGDSSTGSAPAATQVGDVYGFAVDVDNNKLFISVNGTYLNSANPANGTGASFTGRDFSNYVPLASLSSANSQVVVLNAGQRPFNTAAPSGFKALCTANLLDPLIEDPSEHFDTKLWDGNNSTRDITGYNFSPDIVWTKKRSSDDFHALFDKIRGVHNAIRPNHPGSTYTDNALLTDFNSDGFEIGNAGAINASGGTYVGWAWEGGDLVTNSAYSQSQTWSDSLTSSTGFRGSEPAANAFDGSTSTTCSAVGSGIVTYTSPVTVSSSETIRVYVNGGTTNVSVNGGSDQAVSAGSFVTLQFDNPSTTPFTLAFQRPGGADTGVKAIEIGGKVLVDPGVIPIASLNSVMYNKSQTWSTYGTFDDNYGGSYVWAGVFNTDNYFTSNRSLYVSSGTDKWTLTSSISVSSSVEIRTYGNTTIELNADLSDATSKTSTGGSTHHHMTIPFTGNLSSISVSGSGVYLCAVYVDGKQLVDPNLTNYYHDSPSISSTVRANTTAGVSIVQYTGTMSSGDRVAHGLNAAPSVLLIKNTATDNTPWQMYHTVGGNQWSIEPNEGEQPNTSSSNWYYQSPNSSVFYLGGNANVNASATNSMIAYCFAEVEGFSSFGGFEGNSSPNGPFIYTGFKPAFLIIKGYDANHYWAMHDIARDPTNTGGKHYFWLNEDNLETNDGGGSDVDFLSNGFKLRNNGGNWNTAGSYLYLAFAANPFKTGRAH